MIVQATIQKAAALEQPPCQLQLLMRVLQPRTPRKSCTVPTCCLSPACTSLPSSYGHAPICQQQPKLLLYASSKPTYTAYCFCKLFHLPPLRQSISFTSSHQLLPTFLPKCSNWQTCHTHAIKRA